MNSHQHTLCWSCANATGGCSWSEEFVPVKGWIAKPTHTKEFDSYIVVSCPQFERDSLHYGAERLYKKPGPEEEQKKEEPKIVKPVIPDWRQDPATESQLKYIDHLMKEKDVPPFTGNTRGEAAMYITKYRNWSYRR